MYILWVGLMKGALGLNTPEQLFAKLEQELSAVNKDAKDVYSILNAVRDAYHLREWIWHSWMQDNPILLKEITGSNETKDSNWNNWINESFPKFRILREICNGSKHLVIWSDEQITDSYKGGWGQPWGSPWGATGYYVIMDDGEHVSVNELLNAIAKFWAEFLRNFGGK